MAKKAVSPRNRACCMAERIAALPIAPGTQPDTWAPLVLAAIGNDGEAWRIYDDELWRTPQFSYARQLRNSPKWGPKLFAQFRGEDE